LALLYTGGQSVSGADLPSILLWTGNIFSIGGLHLTYGVLLMLALYAVVAFALGPTA